MVLCVVLVVSLLFGVRPAGSVEGVPFTRLCGGMSVIEVLQILGPPTHVYSEAPAVIAKPTDRELIFRTQVRSLYYYAGTMDMPALYVRFADDAVIGKRQGQAWEREPLAPCAPPAPARQPVWPPALIQQVQVRLQVAGFDPGPLDGVLRPQTRAALWRFQATRGLPPTGALDGPTVEALGVP